MHASTIAAIALTGTVALALGLPGAAAQSFETVQFRPAQQQIFGYQGEDQADVTDIQARLRRLGYHVPAVTGRMDEATREAIRAYQREHRLLVTGQAGPELLAHIEETSKTAAAGADSEAVRQVEEALQARGYAIDAVDGVVNESTRDAIRTFQADSRLPMTGEITPDLLAALDIRAGEKPLGISPATTLDSAALRTVLADNFDDGDFTSSPAWQVRSGEFSVAEGKLSSRIDPDEKGSGQLGSELLKGVIGGALGIPLGQPNLAVIQTPAQISNTFRLSVMLSGGGEDATFGFGPYAGNQLAPVYRLESNLKEARPFRLVSVTADGQQSVIATAAPGVNLHDGGMHTVVWERDAEGRMTVTLDDQVVIEARDASHASGFNGVTLVNAGGEWHVDRVEVETVL